MNNQKQFLILVVEDSSLNLQIISDILNSKGYKVAIARNGYEALNFLLENTPDIILLDIIMPGLNGIELCYEIKKSIKTKNIPIIFISALTDISSKVSGFKAGGVDFITKPFQKEEVLARVQIHLALKESMEIIKEQKKQLEESIISKNHFFSIIAHDLKSPFNGLIGITDFFSKSIEEFDKEELALLALDMNKTAINLYRLCENLLDWASLQRGTMTFTPVKFELQNLVKDCVEVLKYNFTQKKIIMKIDVAKQDINCDYDMIHTIMRNLISNAIKFTNVGGCITISSNYLDSGFIEVSVADTGVGMDPGILSKLFRIDIKHGTVGTEGETGTSLGLILCKELVEKNSGKIWAISTLGQGSCFKFTIPSENIFI
ncbi:hybrid sensor histidine kinase/response regulator [Clostridium tagluense]|uniref:hybrid sensor histidine kinase/response regulator n=1 Tax=Clostridium tagluense TaxID=360422 RepID=UPI001CF37D75|nr:hybrid sensor histidine kinase/response regulator [Clostridium tagluense]MCB2298995.1 hybrid sensor histidine kinase/response regulator [Clostridium tagluense]